MEQELTKLLWGLVESGASFGGHTGWPITEDDKYLQEKVQSVVTAIIGMVTAEPTQPEITAYARAESKARLWDYLSSREAIAIGIVEAMKFRVKGDAN